MATTSGTCINRSADGCELHYHPSDNLFTASQPAGTSQTQHLENGGVKSSADNAPSQMAREAGVPSPATTLERKLTAPDVDPGDRASDRGWRRIVRNFTPSYVLARRPRSALDSPQLGPYTLIPPPPRTDGSSSR